MLRTALRFGGHEGLSMKRRGKHLAELTFGKNFGKDLTAPEKAKKRKAVTQAFELLTESDCYFDVSLAALHDSLVNVEITEDLVRYLRTNLELSGSMLVDLPDPEPSLKIELGKVAAFANKNSETAENEQPSVPVPAKSRRTKTESDSDEYVQ